MKTKVYILYTGGTIGMAPRDKEDPFSPLRPKPLAELFEYLPGFNKADDPTKYRSDDAKNLANINASKNAEEQEPFIELDNGNLIVFGSGSFKKPVDSSDVGPVDWKRMAEMIAAVYDDYDGFVILHGTDTMAFTSSALSFIFENLAKPVVVTGSQLPLVGIRTDAPLNFINAINIAGYQATDLPLIPEVVIAFADKVIRGCRASKVSSSNWAGFDSPNFPLLGTIGEHIKINTSYLLPTPSGNKRFFIKTDFDDNVFHLTIFPGFTVDQVSKIVQDSKTKGLVLRTYGTGNVPSDKPEENEDGTNTKGFIETLGDAIDSDNKMIVNLSQCTEGTVEMGLYEASSGLMERGVISGLDMTPEAALTKMMWTLGTQFGEGRIMQMQIDQRGEQTENLFDLRFGALSQKDAKAIYTNAVSPDGRLDRNRISNAMLRISDLGVVGVKASKTDEDENKSAKAKDSEKSIVKIHVFMNMPTADHETSTNQDRHIGTLEFNWDGKPTTRMKNITHATQNVIGSGDVILTLVSESPDIKIYFRGLYIALYAKA